MIATPVAASGPLLVTTIVKVTSSPTFGVGSSTVLVIDRSDCCGLTVASSLLLPGVGSYWSLDVTVAVLVALGNMAAVTVAVMVKVAVPLAAMLSVDQSPVAGV